MLKKTKELIKTIQTMAARIAALEDINRAKDFRISMLEKAILKQKAELKAMEHINSINLSSLWEERMKIAKLEEKLKKYEEVS